MAQPKKNVAYFYDPDVGNFHYGPGHPMKPHRIRMTHNLVMSYELYKKMSIYRAAPATCQEMTQFHSDDYVDFLHRVTPENAAQFQRELSKYNFEEDCPVFDGMFDLFSLSAGSSMEGAARLNRGLSDICINWSGGLHHAKKCEASGFCYINDIVLAILELLRHHQRVLYIDIDVHHGDGVEEAFYTTDRVMTCSFHKYGEYFPGTGDLRDIGEGKGKHYAVNFPLRDGIDDISYHSVFKPVIQNIMEWYQPDAVVLQCGTDSLAGDKLGCFNLSMDGHAECVRFVKAFNLPTLVLGGGGYTIRNVSRVWAYETGILVGAEMDRKLPMNDYMDYYAPEYTLNVPAYNVGNMNSPEYLDRMRSQVLQNIERTRFAPSVQMQDVPRDVDRDTADEDALDPDERMPESARDQHIVPDAEMYEADSMGLRDSSRDGTKVINEETNEQPAPQPEADVEMDESPAEPKAEPELEAETGANADLSLKAPAANDDVASATDVSVPANDAMDVDTDERKSQTAASLVPTAGDKELPESKSPIAPVSNENSSSEPEANAQTTESDAAPAVSEPLTESVEAEAETATAETAMATAADAEPTKSPTLPAADNASADQAEAGSMDIDRKPGVPAEATAVPGDRPNEAVDTVEKTEAQDAESVDPTDPANAGAGLDTSGSVAQDTKPSPSAAEVTPPLSAADLETPKPRAEDAATEPEETTETVAAPENSEENAAEKSATAPADTTASASEEPAAAAAAADEPQANAPRVTEPAAAASVETKPPISAKPPGPTKPLGLAAAPVHKALQEIQALEKEDGEATEDDYDDEDGEIRDS
ncbi:histone deacetylase [Coemansia sp. RSA 1722]|nr:histone deacetylase [Coemansia sp. RSA 1722]